MIDLCVVNYNTRPQLERLIDTLHSDVPVFDRPWNLYVADNGSKDDSVEYLESLQSGYPQYGEENKRRYLTALFKNPNLGYAGACNQMAGFTSGDIIALLNADVWLNSKDVADIQNIFDTNPDIAILGPKQRDERGAITHAGIFGTLEKPVHRGWKVLDKEDRQYRDRVQAVTVSGSAYFIRRTVWDTLTLCPVYEQWLRDTYKLEAAPGAFLPTPHYYEETFCSYHAQAHGFKVYYDGSVSIGHTWHAASEVGGEGDRHWAVSQSMFRSACDAHQIPHD